MNIQPGTQTGFSRRMVQNPKMLARVENPGPRPPRGSVVIVQPRMQAADASPSLPPQDGDQNPLSRPQTLNDV